MTRLITLILLWCASAMAAAQPRPNIVVILADDLGYGDVRCLNPAGKISTPNLDRLAASGMIFTDAHSSSAVCTPTRYGLLTGRYNWRSRLKSHVQGGMSPPLIEPGRLTLPAFLQRHGYHTACVGKWHLGMDWPRKPDTAAFDDTIEKGADGWRVDFSRPIANGPNSFGFDYYFGIAASLDMVPYTFIENTRVTEIPTDDKAFPLMFGRTNRMTRRGPAAASFEAEHVLPTLTRKAVAYIQQRAAAARSGQPFFLYLPLASPHTPIAPTKAWQGRSGLNAYADFVMQTDAEVGNVLDTLQREGLSTNTLVIFTSDNGCSPEAKFDELAAAGHHPSAQFRGAKADIFEGGHRVPFFAAWPARIKAGSASDQLICLNDLFATCAEILGQRLPDTAAEDSVSILPALEGRATVPLREALVHHSINGSFAIRQGKWKLSLCADSGGWSAPRPGSPPVAGLPGVQLYNLAEDVRESKNVQAAHPEIVAHLNALLEKYVADGRSTPGTKQTNTTPVTLIAGAAAAPNILLLLSDDHSYPFLSCYGDPNVKTPAIDQLAAEGMKFHRYFTASPQCVPSRGSLMTGRSPVAARITRFSSPLARDEITFPEILRAKANYFVGVCGRNYHLDGSAQRGSATGAQLLQKHGLRTFDQRFDYVKTGGDAATVAQMTEFLDRKPDGKPFFLWVNFSDPHHVWNAPGEFRPAPASLKLPAHWPDLPGMREQLADYCGEVNRLDRSVKAILDLLAARGFASNTLVVFTGDNGAALPHGKGSLYDPGSNVPFLVRWPGVVQAGRESRTLLSGEDLAPTLLAAAGLNAPEKMSGVSFLPLLKGQPHTPRKYVFVERGPHGSAPVSVNMSSSGYDLARAVRGERYKFIYNCTPWIPYGPVDSAGGAAWTQMKAAHAARELAPGLSAAYFTAPRPVYELYDLEADPSELNNLSGKSELAPVEQELRAALAEKMILDFDYLPLPDLGGGAAPRARRRNAPTGSAE